jgi:hypothetical protein
MLTPSAMSSVPTFDRAEGALLALPPRREVRQMSIRHPAWLTANDYRYLMKLIQSDDVEAHQDLLDTLKDAYGEFERDDSFTGNPMPEGYEDSDEY